MEKENEFILPGEYRTFGQAAKELGVSPATLKMYVWNHRVPCLKLAGSNINIIRMTDLVGYHAYDRKVASLV